MGFGFLAFADSELEMLSNFGVVVSVGSFMCLAAHVALAPALLVCSLRSPKLCWMPNGPSLIGREILRGPPSLQSAPFEGPLGPL